MSEIITTQPLCWILDNEGNRHYKECTLEELQKARAYKTDILTSGDEVLTDYQIAKYGKADTIDRFIYFAFPKYPKKMKDRFKTSVSNMTRERRKELSYEAIKATLDSWIKEENYYS